VTATNWRDLTSELTAKQIASLEYAESKLPAGRVETQETLLDFARHRSLEWGDVPTGVRGVDVAIDGRQEHNGDFNRGVTVYVDGAACLSAEEARRVAAALTEAADKLERLSVEVC
jgi:hypothetical protein